MEIVFARALQLNNDAVLLTLSEGGVSRNVEHFGDKTNIDDKKMDLCFQEAMSAFSCSLEEIRFLISNSNDANRNSTGDVCKSIQCEHQSSPSSHSEAMLYHEDDFAPFPTNQHGNGDARSILEHISASWCTFPNLFDRNENLCFVHNKALLFHYFPDIQHDNDGANSSSIFAAMNSRPSLSWKETMQIYSCFIMFNIALAYHQKALCFSSSGKQQTKMFRNAENMYEIVAQSMHSKASIINSIRSTNLGVTALLVKAAAVNNLSQLQYRRCDYMESFKGFQFLGSLILHSVGDLIHRDESSLCQPIRQICQEDEDTYRHMLLNVYFMYPPKLAAAA